VRVALKARLVIIDGVGDEYAGAHDAEERGDYFQRGNESPFASVKSQGCCPKLRAICFKTSASSPEVRPGAGFAVSPGPFESGRKPPKPLLEAILRSAGNISSCECVFAISSPLK